WNAQQTDDETVAVLGEILVENPLESLEMNDGASLSADATQVEVKNNSELESALRNSSVSKITFAANYEGERVLLVGDTRFSISRALEVDASALEGGFEFQMSGSAQFLFSISATDQSVTFRNISFSGIQSDSFKSAVYVEGGNISFHSCTFSGNTSTVGAAIYVAPTATGTILIANSTFDDNHAVSNNGGAITSYSASLSMTIQESVFTQNSCTSEENSGSGGAIYTSGALVVQDSEFRNNSAHAGNGGAIHASGSLEIRDSLFVDNVATNIGESPGSGGAVSASGALKVQSSQFYRNKGDFGAALVCMGTDAVVVSNSIFAANSASQEGSTSQTIYLATSETTAYFYQTTVVAAGSEMGIYTQRNLCSWNTLVQSGSGDGVYACSSQISGGGNLFSSAYGDQSGATSGTVVFTSYTGEDETLWDFTLTTASAGFNAGVSAYALDVDGAALETDIYGRARVVDNVDIGAAEQSYTTETLSAPLPTCTASGTSGVQISWSAVENATAYALRYRISHDEINSSGWITLENVAYESSAASDVLSYSIDLIEGTTIEVQMRAIGNNENTFSSVWSDSTRYTVAEVVFSTILHEGESETDVFSLHSLPGASRVIYLDFTGHITTGTGWNSTYGADMIVHQPYATGGTTGFTQTELAAIYEIWQRVAEDYAPFNVDVTTEFPGLEALRYSGSSDAAWGVRCVISRGCFLGESAAGVSFQKSFVYSSDTPAFIFTEYASSKKTIAEVISHEVGHTVGLGHRGHTSASIEYYYGANGWAPIMGAGYNVEMTQWSDGTYDGAVSYSYPTSGDQDDLSIITQYLPYRDDDHASFSGASWTADTLDSSPSSLLAGTTSEGLLLSNQGIIERNTDNDVFVFETQTEGVLSLEIVGVGTWSNLDIRADLLNENYETVWSAQSTDSINAALSGTLAAGTYYLVVSGDGKTVGGTVYYTNYASLGQYFVSGSFATEVSLTPPTLEAQLSGDNAAIVSWNDVSWADSYLFEYALSADFSDAISIPFDSAGSQTIEGLDFNRQYYFRVTALATGGVDAAVSNSTSIFTNKGTIVGVSVENIRVVYSGEPHTLRVSGLLEGDEVLYSADGGHYSSEAPTFTNVVDTTIWVLVRRADYTDWTCEATVVVEPSVLATPGNIVVENVSDSAASVRWDAIPNASAYEIAWDGGSATVDSNSYEIQNLTRDTEYVLSIRAIGEGNYATSSAESATFRTSKSTIEGVSLAGVTKVYDGESWTPQILGAEPGDTISYSIDGENFDATLPSFVAAGEYKVWAKVERAGFFECVVSADVSISPYELISPVVTLALNDSDNAFVISWEEQAHAQNYRVEYTLSSDFSNAQFVDFDAAGAHTLEGLNSSATYYFRVLAQGESCVEAVSETHEGVLNFRAADAPFSLLLRSKTESLAQESVAQTNGEIPSVAAYLIQGVEAAVEFWTPAGLELAPGSVWHVEISCHAALYSLESLFSTHEALQFSIEETRTEGERTIYRVKIEVSATLAEPFETQRVGVCYFNALPADGVLERVDSTAFAIGESELATQVRRAPYDLDNDGKIHVDDLILLIRQYGSKGENLAADFNSNGCVEAQDLIDLILNFAKNQSQFETLTLPSAWASGTNTATSASADSSALAALAALPLDAGTLSEIVHDDISLGNISQDDTLLCETAESNAAPTGVLMEEAEVLEISNTLENSSVPTLVSGVPELESGENLARRVERNRAEVENIFALEHENGLVPPIVPVGEKMFLTKRGELGEKISIIERVFSENSHEDWLLMPKKAKFFSFSG
ncbi:MAG: hypothetical protein Q4D38_02825, partial [Planctomycetia bacterium]|nr:hypothetical protein [Planctomycetia bacterium]